MKNLHDVQKLLKKFNIIVYVGKRKWDNNLLLSFVLVSKKEYMNAKLILSHEHEIEEEKETSTKDSNRLL